MFNFSKKKYIHEKSAKSFDNYFLNAVCEAEIFYAANDIRIWQHGKKVGWTLCCGVFYIIIELIWVCDCWYQVLWFYTLINSIFTTNLHEKSSKSYLIIVFWKMCVKPQYFMWMTYAFGSTINKWCESYVEKDSWLTSNSRVCGAYKLFYYFLIAVFEFDEFIHFKSFNLLTKGRQNHVIV